MSIWNLCTYVKKIAFILVLAGLVVACQKQDRETITIQTLSGQQVAFDVLTAKTPQEQQKGLMFVEEMPDNEGMIFLYPKPQRSLFWMKNTLIPLDMLFFDATNTLVHIEHSAKPHDETPRGPDGKICSVLEINGGLAKEMGIATGSKLLGNIAEECLQYAQ